MWYRSRDFCGPLHSEHKPLIGKLLLHTPLLLLLVIFPSSLVVWSSMTQPRLQSRSRPRTCSSPLTSLCLPSVGACLCPWHQFQLLQNSTINLSYFQPVFFRRTKLRAMKKGPPEKTSRGSDREGNQVPASTMLI